MILNSNHCTLQADVEEASLKLNGIRNYLGGVEDRLRYYAGRAMELEYSEPYWNTAEEIAYNKVCNEIDRLSDERDSLRAKELHLAEFINHLEEADKALRWFEICEEEEG